MNRSVCRLRKEASRLRFSKFAVLILLPASFLTAGCGGEGRVREPASPVVEKAQSRPKAAAAAKAPEIKVIENAPTLKGSNSVVGGVVQNVSDEQIENLSLELELSRRDDGSKESREVAVTPNTLAPGVQGKYALTISNREWATTKILRVKSSSQTEDLAFTTQPGAKRPPERLPENKKVVVVQRPKPKGEEFLNSPDKAEPIP